MHNHPSFRDLWPFCRVYVAAIDLDPNTVSRLENSTDVCGSTPIKLQYALEAAGVIFIDGSGEGPGVRLKKKKS